MISSSWGGLADSKRFLSLSATAVSIGCDDRRSKPRERPLMNGNAVALPSTKVWHLP